jgi:uncharacterized lipoprotein YehR (DUF1307 family)
MNIVKLTNRMLILLFLLISFNAPADSAKTKKYFKELEVDGLKINLFKDGTGLVKNGPCSDCTSRYYKITKNTKVAKNGVEIDIQQVIKRAGKSVGISVDPKTREVQYIYWSER